MALRAQLGQRSVRNPAPFDKYPAKQHAQRVAEKLGVEDGLIYLPGTPDRQIEDSDMPIPFRQRRYFYYITGVSEADCHATYDIGADILSLYIPTHDLHDTIYNGPGLSIPGAYTKYDVDVVSLSSTVDTDVEAWVKENDAPIYILHEQQKPKTKLGDKTFDTESLQKAMNLARVIKDHHEIEMIRKANDISAEAHRNVLRKIKSFTSESEVAGIFMDTCMSNGAPNQAYDIIAAGGENASTLHYARNNDSLVNRQLMCLDAGCEYDMYASDVTRSFPLSGSWTKEAQEIYNIVQAMQDACVSRMGAGVRYLDLHVLAHKVAIKGLLDLGILYNGSVEEIYKAGTSLAFYPHGLGHHVGLDVHDVLYRELLQPSEVAPEEFDRRKAIWQAVDILALHEYADSPYGTILEEDMVLTVEPGIYFNRLALESVYLPSPVHAKFIDRTVLKRYLPVGGVRIEDNYLITSEGNENLTTAPKGDEALRIINGEDTASPMANLPYCPIRGRLELQTRVDTREIRRSTKRRLASLHYAEELRKATALQTQAETHISAQIPEVASETQSEVPTVKISKQRASSETSSKRTKTGCKTCRRPKTKCEGAKPSCLECRKHNIACEGYGSHRDRPAKSNQAQDVLRRQANETASLALDRRGKRLPWMSDGAERGDGSSTHWLVDGKETEEMLAAIEEAEQYEDAQEPPYDRSTSWNDFEASRLISVDEAPLPPLPMLTTSPTSLQKSKELEWFKGATLFQNFEGPPAIPPKLPEIPEVPAKPLPYRNSSASLRSAYHSAATGPLLVDYEDRGTSLRHAAAPYPMRSNTTGRLHDSELHRARRPMVQKLDHGFRDSKTSSQYFLPEEQYIDQDPFSRARGEGLRNTSARQAGSLRNRQSMPVLTAIPPTTQPPVVRQLAFRTIDAAASRSDRMNNPFRRPHTALDAIPDLSSDDQAGALKPWWLVQAEGKLRRKHPRVSFNLRRCPFTGWEVVCSHCYWQSSSSCIMPVGPGLTLDEFEQHLWSVDHPHICYTPLDQSEAGEVSGKF